MRILAVLALVLAGCAYIGGAASPSPAATTAPTSTTERTDATNSPPTATPEDRDAQHRAQAALQHWANFMADRPSDTIVFTDELTNGGGWQGQGAGDAKVGFLSGMIEATVDLPTETPPLGQVTWPDGTTQEVPLISAADALNAMVAELRGDDSQPACGNCLQVVGATLKTRSVKTSHGDASVPVWQFEFTAGDEPIDPISYVAVKDRVGPQDWPTWGDHAPFTDAAYAAAGDSQITITFIGGACDASHSIVAAESSLAIVPIITTVVRPGPCTAQGVLYGLEVSLASPLGDRVVLDADSGFPVPVYPEAPPDGLRPD